MKEPCAKIGALTVERDFFSVGWSAEPLRTSGDGGVGGPLSLNRQCELPGVGRALPCREPAGKTRTTWHRAPNR